ELVVLLLEAVVSRASRADDVFNGPAVALCDEIRVQVPGYINWTSFQTRQIGRNFCQDRLATPYNTYHERRSRVWPWKHDRAVFKRCCCRRAVRPIFPSRMMYTGGCVEVGISRSNAIAASTCASGG